MCVVGVVGSLIVYGILQERIMTRPYGVESEYFKYSVFLVLSNRVLSASLAAAILAYTKGMVQPAAPIWKYAGVSASNVLATTCQYEALRYVSFPVQTLGKCAKMIPVMIWGYFINQRRYTLNDYVIAACVTLGCTIFALYGDLTHKHSAKSSNTSAKGLMLMLGYLGFDGFTSTFQDKLFKGYQMETYNQMLYVNGVSACLSVAWLLSDGAIWAGPGVHRPSPRGVIRHHHSVIEFDVRSTLHPVHHQRVRRVALRRHHDDATAPQHSSQLRVIPPSTDVAAMVWHRLSFLRALRPGVFEERAAALARSFAPPAEPIRISILHRLSECTYITYNSSIRFMHNYRLFQPRPTDRVIRPTSHARASWRPPRTRDARSAPSSPREDTREVRRRDRDARATRARRRRRARAAKTMGSFAGRAGGRGTATARRARRARRRARPRGRARRDSRTTRDARARTGRREDEDGRERGDARRGIARRREDADDADDARGVGERCEMTDE